MVSCHISHNIASMHLNVNHCITLYPSCTRTDKLEVFVRPDGERGVRTLEAVKNGSFLCEFEGNLLTKEECEEAEREYSSEGKPVYILEVSNRYIRETLHVPQWSRIYIFPCYID